MGSDKRLNRIFWDIWHGFSYLLKGASNQVAAIIQSTGIYCMSTKYVGGPAYWRNFTLRGHKSAAKNGRWEHGYR